MPSCTLRIIFTVVLQGLLCFSIFEANSEGRRVGYQESAHDVPANGGKTFTLQPSGVLTLNLKRTELSWQFVIFQAHSLYRISLASKNPRFLHDSTNSGSDASVLYKFPYMLGEQNNYFYVRSNSSKKYEVDVISVPYRDGAPFPGGCCLTCNMDLDPNIQIKYDSVKTNITFSFANVFFRRNEKEVPCDGNTRHPGLVPDHYRLKYSIYQMFLPEGNLEENELFKGLKKMAYPAVIRMYGEKITSLQAPTIPRVTFDTTPGQGVIYNVIVHDPDKNKEAAYTPVHTYGCSFTSKVGSCQSIVSTVNQVFAGFGTVLGLIMCFFGHRLFKITLFLGGMVNFSFIFFIIFSEATELTHLDRMLLSAGVGAFCGLMVFTLWWFTEYTRLCLLINALFLGFLCAGSLLFTSVGDSDIWESDFDYGMVIVAITVVIPITMLPWPKVLSIVYTSVVSAYGFIIGIDTFIHTSMSYLVLNIVIRAVESNYSNTIVRRPFQTNDIILTCTWVVLALSGIASQFYTTKRRLEFPKSGYLEQKRVRKYYDKGTYDENTPILINTQGYRHNDIC